MLYIHAQKKTSGYRLFARKFRLYCNHHRLFQQVCFFFGQIQEYKNYFPEYTHSYCNRNLNCKMLLAETEIIIDDALCCFENKIL